MIAYASTKSTVLMKAQLIGMCSHAVKNLLNFMSVQSDRRPQPRPRPLYSREMGLVWLHSSAKLDTVCNPVNFFHQNPSPTIDVANYQTRFSWGISAENTAGRAGRGAPVGFIMQGRSSGTSSVPRFLGSSGHRRVDWEQREFFFYENSCTD